MWYGYDPVGPLFCIPTSLKCSALRLTCGLSVSQFTLLASTKKGTKPNFQGAANPEQAKLLYESFVNKVKEGYDPSKVKDGRFQAMMEVALINDGPVSCGHVQHRLAVRMPIAAWLMALLR